MENLIVVKVPRPTLDQEKRYKKWLTHYQDLESRGALKEEEFFLIACSNTYSIQTVCHILRMLRIPHTLTEGKPIRKRGKKCGTSTATQLAMVSITAELLKTPTGDFAITMPESVTQPEEESGQDTS